MSDVALSKCAVGLALFGMVMDKSPAELEKQAQLSRTFGSLGRWLLNPHFRALSRVYRGRGMPPLLRLRAAYPGIYSVLRSWPVSRFNNASARRLLRMTRAAKAPERPSWLKRFYTAIADRDTGDVDEAMSLLGNRMSAGEFMEANPYNGFTVYKGHVMKPFHGEMAESPQDLLFMSGRPTVALDYHVRPTSMSRGHGIPMLATGDIRGSRSFLEGDRFFSPQSASVDLKAQIAAAKRGMGTQQFYRSGYHGSSNAPDFEIPIPRHELGSVFNKYYTAGFDGAHRFMPFGDIAERYGVNSFNSLPFSFRRISDPDRFSVLVGRMSKGELDRFEGISGVLPMQPASSKAHAAAQRFVGATRPAAGPPTASAQSLYGIQVPPGGSLWGGSNPSMSIPIPKGMLPQGYPSMMNLSGPTIKHISQYGYYVIPKPINGRAYMVVNGPNGPEFLPFVAPGGRYA